MHKKAMCPVVFIVSPPFSFYFSAFLLFFKEGLVCCHVGQFSFLIRCDYYFWGSVNHKIMKTLDKLWKQPAMFFSEKG